MYIDQLVRMLKRRVGLDGYLGALLTMLLMDDMVVLATSRDMCIRKLSVVFEYWNIEYAMVLNEKKKSW